MYVMAQWIFFSFLVLLMGCRSNTPEEERVVSQKFMHKYGYPISKKDWETNAYPGEVSTRFGNGITMTAEYVDGKLHGLVTYTFPHSSAIERKCLYDLGELRKETRMGTSGSPIYEKEILSPHRIAIRTWYDQGSPRTDEVFSHGNLLEGTYFTIHNVAEAEVTRGQGVRMERNERGLLLAKELIENGHPVFRETFYSNGMLASKSALRDGKIHGTRSTFGQDGDPLAVEEWVDGNLHGLATYFKNGIKYREVPYHSGKKEGVERTFIDGRVIEQEISWENDVRHGLTTIYVDGNPEIEQWYYRDNPVRKERFDELVKFDLQIQEGHRMLNQL